MTEKNLIDLRAIDRTSLQVIIDIEVHDQTLDSAWIENSGPLGLRVIEMRAFSFTSHATKVANDGYGYIYISL